MTTQFHPIEHARDRADAVRLISEAITEAGVDGVVALDAAEVLLARVRSEARYDLAWIARDAGGAPFAVFLADLETLTPADAAHTYRVPRRLASPLFGFCARPGAEPAAVQQLIAALRVGPLDNAVLLSIEVAATARDLAAALESSGLHENARLCRAETAALLPSSGRSSTAGVRRATTADLSQIAAFAREESRYQATETRSGTSIEQSRSTFERVSRGWLSDPDTAVFLISVDDGDAEGMIVVETSVDEPGSTSAVLVDVPCGYIAVLFVAPHARGRGLGDALVGAAASWAKGRGLSRLTLHFIADNPLSAPFWTSRGFVPVALEYLGAVESLARSDG